METTFFRCRSRAGSVDSMTNLLRLLLLWQSLNNSSEDTEPNGPQILVETKGFVKPNSKIVLSLLRNYT